VFDEVISTAEAGLVFSGPDVLAAYPPDVVAGWYKRLALATQGWFAKSRPGGGQSLSSAFLLYWQDSSRASQQGGVVVWDRTTPKVFDVSAVDHNETLRERLVKEVRPVLLTERQLGHDANKGYGGAVRKLQQGWDGTALELKYKAGSIEGATNADKAKFVWGMEREVAPETLDWGSMDVYASLHTFAIESTVVIRATPVPGDEKRFTIRFDSWTWKAVDYYDWDDPNPNKWNDMPNPDFEKVPGPSVVAPDEKYFTVWHRNARRVEAAGLAAPFPVESTVHTETAPELLKSAVVRIDKNLGSGR
jgi:hypothetical protein